MASAFHPGLDDAPFLLQLVAEMLPILVACLEAQSAGQVLIDPVTQPWGPAVWSTFEAEYGVALAGEATSRASRRSSAPSGKRMPAARKIRREPLLLPRFFRAGSQAYSGTPRRTARVRSSGVELKTERWAIAGSPMASRSRCNRRGRSRILRVSDASDPSQALSSVSLRRACAEGTPGSMFR
jgi:hypothetical protein